MKAGILTFHKAPNYGAAIQAFALREFLTNKGCESHIIDFQCNGNGIAFSPKNARQSAISSSNPAKRFLKKIRYDLLYARSYREKWQKFSSFVCSHLLVDSTPTGYDVLLFGSDQIWNPRVTGGFKEEYFGKGADENTVCASYAASCGDLAELNGEEKVKFLELLSNLDFVSVRESGLHAFLKENGVDNMLVADPTFLLSKEEYIRKLGLERRQKKKYVFEYALQNNPQLDLLAKEIAREKGLEVVKICGYVGFGQHGIYHAGPIDFMNYLNDAEYVVTNSFHGVALSVTFEKDFAVVLPMSRKGRITDLLESLEISERIYRDEIEAVLFPVCYNKVNDRLAFMRHNSVEYLRNILEGIANG